MVEGRKRVSGPSRADPGDFSRTDRRWNSGISQAGLLIGQVEGEQDAAEEEDHAIRLAACRERWSDGACSNSHRSLPTECNGDSWDRLGQLSSVSRWHFVGVPSDWF